jgi:RluA family pseudouridine synthase
MSQVVTNIAPAASLLLNQAPHHVVPDPIPPTAVSHRMTNYAHAVFPTLNTVTRARKLIKRGFILLNGQTVETSRMVKPNDVLSIDVKALNKQEQEKAIVYKLNIPVLYEDNHLAIVDKPAGIVTNGDRKRSLEHALSFNLTASTELDALVVPQPVHRLDLMTGGLVCVAKTRLARRQLGHEFEHRRVHKRYRAIVVGYVKDETGTCTTPIDNKQASTLWKVVSRTRSLHTEWITTLDLWPNTGRKHQLRIHCANEMGHPIVGDKTYTLDQSTLCHKKGMFLRALELSFENVMMQQSKAGPEVEKKGQDEEECRLLRVEINEPHKYHAYRSSEERLYVKHRSSSSSSSSSSNTKDEK